MGNPQPPFFKDSQLSCNFYFATLYLSNQLYEDSSPLSLARIFRRIQKYPNFILQEKNPPQVSKPLMNSSL